MSETMIAIVPVADHLRPPRWRAVGPHGSVAGEAGLRPATPFPGHFLPRTRGPTPIPSGLGPSPSGIGPGELDLDVQPQWRRRGIGSRLLSAVRAGTTATRLTAEVEAGSPGEAFCRHHGFHRAGSRRHDLLTYGDVHRAWLGELVDTEHHGYRLAHRTGPDVLLITADAAGDLAAYAVAFVEARPDGRARLCGPVWQPGHRGQRLALWVNAALVQRLGELHPQVNEIETITAEDDPGLLAIREHLGFRPVRRTRLYQLDEL